MKWNGNERKEVIDREKWNEFIVYQYDMIYLLVVFVLLLQYHPPSLIFLPVNTSNK